MTKVQLKKRDREYEDVLGGMLRAWSLLGMKFSRPKHLEKGKKKEKVKKGDICTEKERRKDVTTWIFLYRNCQGFPERDRPGKESLEKDNLGKGTR